MHSSATEKKERIENGTWSFFGVYISDKLKKNILSDLDNEYDKVLNNIEKINNQNKADIQFLNNKIFESYLNNKILNLDDKISDLNNEIYNLKKLYNLKKYTYMDINRLNKRRTFLINSFDLLPRIYLQNNISFYWVI